MSKNSRFVIMEHSAKRAGLHYDVRFQKPGGSKWISFASRKPVPLTTGAKVMITRTHDHTEDEALFTGEIKSGYGAGFLKKWDEGSCEIIRYNPPRHIVIKFNGKKIKGVYHMLATKLVFKEKEGNTYLFFKGKNQE